MVSGSLSRWQIFCLVVDVGNFTRVAEQIGYSQSAVSQMIKAMEKEFGATLLERRKDGVVLTADGRQYYPYIQAIAAAEEALSRKQREMDGLENNIIRIGAFTSISRNLLPPLMQQFKCDYPGVEFVIRQGDYGDILRWIHEGSVDFGFVSSDAAAACPWRPLYRDELMAVLPEGHPLARLSQISLRQLAQEPFILVDEGRYNTTLDAFAKYALSPKVEYTVFDDYSILSMVRQGLGISVLYQFVVAGVSRDLCCRPIAEHPGRTVVLAWRNWDTMSLAARRFAEHITDHIDPVLQSFSAGGANP